MLLHGSASLASLQVKLKMKNFLIITSILLCGLFSLSTSAAFTSFKNGAKKTTRPLYLNDTSVPRPLMKYPSQGGLNRTAFDDLKELLYIVGIQSINLTQSDRINSISVTYFTSGGSTYTAPTRGKPSDVSVRITFPSNFHISKIEFDTNGSYVSQLTFHVLGPRNDRRIYGPYGKPGNASFSFETQVIAFHGSSSSFIDRIGVYGLPLINQSQAIGGYGGNEFGNEVPFGLPAVVGIRAISIWSGSIVDGIQTEYLTLDKGTVLGIMHGKGLSKNMSKITFSEGENLELVEGWLSTKDPILVDRVTFTSRKTDGSTVKHGPYGQLSTDNNFTCSGNIIGFLGSAGSQINRLGVFSVGNSTSCKTSH